VQWTYGEDVQVQEECGGQEGMATTIHAKLYPNTGEREEQRFVEVELVLTGEGADRQAGQTGDGADRRAGQAGEGTDRRAGQADR